MAFAQGYVQYFKLFDSGRFVFEQFQGFFVAIF